MKRNLIVYAGLGLFLIAGIAATRPPLSATPPNKDPGEERHYRNLKVLPKDIDEEAMEQLMESYSRSIGVTCLYCHVRTKPGIVPERADFPSDENPNKQVARKMMRLTVGINRKFFHYKVKYDFTAFTKAPVNCRTCHQGRQIPVERKH